MKISNSRMDVNGERGLFARFALVVVLTLTLLAVMRWAMNVTNANAKQISHNLTQMQEHLDDAQVHAARGRTGIPGPTIDPGGDIPR